MSVSWCAACWSTNEAMVSAALNLSDISQDVWDAVPVEPRTPMRQYIWAKAYEETLARGAVKAVLVGSKTQPQALAPFAEPASGPRRQVLLGAEDLWESVEVAAPDEDSQRELAESLARSGVPLRFGHYPTDTPFLELLKCAYRGKGRVVVAMQPNKAMPRIELDRTWAEPESHFNSRRRSDFRRMARKAEKLGAVTFEIIEPSAENIDALLDEAFAIEAASWKGRTGTAINQDERTQAFYRSYALRAMQGGILRLCFMRVDDKAAAMQFAVECDERFWLLKVGYDETYRHVSPGNLLMRETIRYAAERGLKGYEFLGKEAEWTKLWADGARPIATVRTYPYNWRGLTAFSADLIDLAGKRIRARIGTTEGQSHA